MKSGNVFCQSLCTRRANGSKQKSIVSIYLFLWHERRQTRNRSTPRSRHRNSHHSVARLGEKRNGQCGHHLETIQSCPKKTSCPKMCCQTIQFVEIYKLSKYTNCPKETKLSKKYKVEKKCGVRKYKVVRKMCCQKDNLSTHTYVLHNTRSTYHHHHGAP